ncbi:MAG: hypothetical protein IPP91_13095 [Betaproteobacteria bacterium]|nr:hypothetical protein [Betaproteobacteria bacterium]
MRYLIIALSLLVAQAMPARAEVSFGFQGPGISIGINIPTYPQLVRIPGYPVYYAPQASSNYFFYDGLYWVFRTDNWYSSSWYNGPWYRVGPEYVPLYVLRVPVRYYRQPPAYFRGWRADAPPRWGDHWGRDWEARRSGWDRWDHRSSPSAAPLPSYQRQYSGERYPRAAEQQQSIRSGNYRYQPRESVAQQHYHQQGGPGGSRAQPQQHAPAPQQTPTYQQHSQPGQQRQQQPHQMQPPQSNSQGKGHDNKSEEHGQDRK